jgi:hypothetical protein
VALDAQQIASGADRPVRALTRRDVAKALLAAGPGEALAALPALRRQLIAAGNPMSALFWESAGRTVQRIAEHAATVGEVQDWLEATGTEPASMIGMLVWDEPDERSAVQAEIYQLLVRHLEDQLAAGRISPDELIGGGAALADHRHLQERWMMAPLPDGRVPMWTVLDESDEQFLAEWDAAEAEALTELDAALAQLPDRPLPGPDLQAATVRVRAVMRTAGGPRDLLAACGGVDPARLPGDDRELWLALAAGIISPAEELAPGDLDDPDVPGDLDGDPDYADDDLDGYDDLTADEQALVGLCALDHYDWLAVTLALARGGPGTPATARALARYVREYDPDDVDDQADAAAEMFSHAVGFWEVLGVVDNRERLTPLGWWGLPEAVRRAWAPADR